MDKVTVADVDSWMAPASVRRPLAPELGAEDLALNYFELETGETFGFGYHRHHDQEEMFVVLEGTATFETEDGDVSVGTGEAIRFAPGEWQLGRNAGEERVVALAIGAPGESTEIDVRRECPDCGERTPASIERAPDADALVTVCEDCGAETGRYT